jgi:rod shape-determining protein MreC
MSYDEELARSSAAEPGKNVMGGSGTRFHRRRGRSWREPGELLVFALYFLCVVLLVLSRIGHGVIADMRDRLADLTAPLLGAASAPVVELRHGFDRVRSYVGLFGEIDRLKAENECLKAWEWRAKTLERKVEQLHTLLNAVDEPGLNFATGRVIADARGPFVRSALTNLGRDQGVRVGYAVISGDGLVGRTVDVGASVSRVLLLNDLNSRIPVLVGPAGARALVVGDNSADLRLEFLADGSSLYPGDEVYTSGSDGVLPRGLRVGTVTGAAGAFKVRSFAELNSLDAVSVLFFDSPALTSTDPPASTTSRVLSSLPQNVAKVSSAAPEPSEAQPQASGDEPAAAASTALVAPQAGDRQ